MIYTDLMLEMCLLLLVAAVFLPDLIFGGVLGVLWLVEKMVIGVCHLILTLLALVSAARGAGNDSVSSRQPLPPPAH